MILLGLGLGLGLGLVAGGSVGRLVDSRLRWVVLIFAAAVLRFGGQVAITNGSEIADTLRIPIFVGAFALLVVVAWLNRTQPGFLAVAVGAASNGLAILANGGYMPVWQPALEVSGLGVQELQAGFHVLLPQEFGVDFLLHAGPIADIIPIPLPLITNVASIGDAFIGAGLGWFVFATLLRGSADPAGPGVTLGGGPRTPESDEALTGFDRPVVLGRTRGAPLGSRISGHPYVRLARDPRFAAFWLAQTISLFGDRLHQVAIAVLVLAITNSPLAAGLVFFAATLPNIFLGPIAGTFVDRWDHKRVLVASDFIRAALVLLIPFAAAVNVILVYPLVFLITTVSLFFRPAKIALLPRIVRGDDLLAANSATWTADTIADIAGYPLAGLFVALLGTGTAGLGLAFFADSASYVLSGVLIALISVAPIVREKAVDIGNPIRTFADELVEGWRFLRHQPALFQNTLISTVAQMTVGVTLALTIVYARDVLDGSLIPYPQNYAAIETAIGVGNLLGGVAVGIIGARLRKGWLITVGFIVMGLSTVLFGLTDNVALALVLALVIGIANLVYIVPAQTMFMELTPNELIGRVIAFRGSLVFGSMTLAMAIAGVLAESVSAGLVIAGFGALMTLAGLVGALLPAVRDA